MKRLVLALVLITIPVVAIAQEHASAPAAEHGGGETIKFFNLLQAVQLPNVGSWVSFVHEIGSKLGIALLIVHVAAALKHQFYDKMKLLQRMKPF